MGLPALAIPAAKLILGALGIGIPFVMFELQRRDMNSTYAEFQDLMDRLIIGEPMTFADFMGAGGWLFLSGCFLLLLVFLLIAFPNPKKKNKGGVKN